jgi:hypothetical protein
MMDPERERMRLAELYAGMDDGQLEELAEDRASLTDVARRALELELSRRHLSIASDESSPCHVEAPELTTVRTFNASGEALLARGLLESGGIECYLSDENNAVLDLDGFGFVREIRLQVRPEDAEAALEVLNQPMTTDSEIEP